MGLQEKTSRRASEQTRKRDANRYEILRALHFKGALHRSELSRMLKIRKSSVTSIVAELLDSGVIKAVNPGNLRTTLTLDSEKFHVLSASLHPGKICFARVYLDGSIHHAPSLSFDRHDSTPEKILELIAGGFQKLLRHDEGIVMGLALADMGTVNPDNGITHFAANLPNWRNVPVRQTLETKLRLAVHVDSDIRSQLGSNAWFDRYANLYSDMLYVGILDGVAGASIIHGRMVVGNSFSAGEFGHVRAGDEMRVCGCGKSDCLETYCSAPAVLAEIERVRPDLKKMSSVADVAKLAREDHAVENVLDRIIQRLAGVLGPIVAAIDPQAVIIASRDREFSEILARLLHKHLKLDLTGLGCAEVEIIAGQPADNATLKGIAAIVIEKSFKTASLKLPPGF